jgi:hypothetical protein
MPEFHVYFDAVIHVSSYVMIDAPTPEEAEAILTADQSLIETSDDVTLGGAAHITEVTITAVEEDDDPAYDVA